MVYFFALDREDALNGNAIALPRQYQERKPVGTQATDASFREVL
jgi:hypothetical protein